MQENNKDVVEEKVEKNDEVALDHENRSFHTIIPNKHYFTIGEISRLCNIKTHLLRYWEHEFPQLKNVRRRGNRRYYTKQQVMIVKQICSLVCEQGYTIAGARSRMAAGSTTGISSRVQQEESKGKSTLNVQPIIKELENIYSLLQTPVE